MLDSIRCYNLDTAREDAAIHSMRGRVPYAVVRLRENRYEARPLQMVDSDYYLEIGEVVEVWSGWERTS